MRPTLTVVAVVGLLAIGAGAADARQTEQTARINAAQHAATMRAQGRHGAALRAATTGNPEYDAGHASTATAAAKPRPIVRVVRAPATRDGFDWADAGIGAGLAAGLMSLALARESRRRRTLARPARPRPSHAQNG
jgi:hypothetical protein